MTERTAGEAGSESVLSMRELSAAERDAWAPRLLRLQHAAYAVEAELIGDRRIPPLHETEDELRDAGLHWLAAFEGDDLVGALGFTVADGEVDLDRLIVAPERHRRGIGVRMVTRALSFAPRTIVSTGRANRPARALYERLGFTHERDTEVIPGLWVSSYQRG